MAALLEDRPPGLRGRCRPRAWRPGRLAPSRRRRRVFPIAAALAGGGLWTIVAAGAAFQPVPLDWPGYLADTLPMAMLAVGVPPGRVDRLRASDRRPAARCGRCSSRRSRASAMSPGSSRSARPSRASSDGPTLAAAQTLALVGTALIGVLLVRAGDDLIGLVLLAGSSAMIIPWAMTWLAFGAAWTAVGLGWPSTVPPSRRRTWRDREADRRRQRDPRRPHGPGGPAASASSGRHHGSRGSRRAGRRSPCGPPSARRPSRRRSMAPARTAPRRPHPPPAIVVKRPVRLRGPPRRGQRRVGRLRLGAISRRRRRPTRGPARSWPPGPAADPARPASMPRSRASSRIVRPDLNASLASFAASS